jgi:hypothetical protein
VVSKVRNIWWLNGIFLGCFLVAWSNSLAGQVPTDSFKVTQDVNLNYRSQKQMFDSIHFWIFNKVDYPNFGLLPETEFKKFVKLSDSLASDKTIFGQFMQYRWTVAQGFKKLKKKVKKAQMKEDKTTFRWNKRLEYKSEGIYDIRRVEVPFSFKKKEYLLRFECLWWCDNVYHVGKIQIIEDSY